MTWARCVGWLLIASACTTPAPPPDAAAPVDAAPDAPAIDAVVGDAPPIDAPPTDAATLPPPRLLAPLSTSTVTGPRPTLRWAIAEGATRTRIELCATRRCEAVLSQMETSADHARPDADLAPGVVFWRALALDADGSVRATSATWQLYVRPGTGAAVDTSWGSVADFDGDGTADLYTQGWRHGGTDVFTRDIDARPDISDLVPTPDDFGRAVASGGDVDGDGLADLVIGAGRARAPGGADGEVGAIFVYRGTPSGPDFAHRTELQPAGTFQLGSRVGAAGDVDGDGYADVWARSADRDAIFFGGPGGLDAARVLVTAARTVPVGDLDADGRVDFVVVTPTDVTIALGAPDAATALHALAFTPPSGAATIAAVVPAGDVDGDGYADFADVEAPDVWIVRGGPGGLASDAPLHLVGVVGTSTGDALPIASGDVDADGFDDLLTADATAGPTYAGEVRVFRGSATGLEISPSLRLGTGTSYEHVGSTLVFLGDADGDGHPEIAAGGDWMGASASETVVFRGSAGGPVASGLVRLHEGPIVACLAWPTLG